MFEWNLSELLVIAGLGILLFSPKELPRIVVGIIRGIRHLRDQLQRFLKQLEDEIDGDQNGGKR